MNDEIEEYNDETPIDRIKKTAAKKGYDLFCLELPKEDKDALTVSRKFCVLKFINAKKSSDNAFTFKRPMYYDPKTATGYDVYFRVYKFLFKLALNRGYTVYTEPEKRDFEKAFSDKNKIPFEIYNKGGKGK